MTLDKRILHLNKIVSRALRPDVRQALLDELHGYHNPSDLEDSDQLSVAIMLAKWMRREYMTWLPEVIKHFGCEQPMELGVYTKSKAVTFKPNSKSWTGYDAVEADQDSLCNRMERWVCVQCSEVKYVGRENDVMILMRTRSGRCGETAILYTSFLLALGMHTRFVAAILDGSDHVWTELRVRNVWVPIDVSALNDPERLIKDRLLFSKWGWKLQRVYALEPGKMPVEIGETYRQGSA